MDPKVNQKAKIQIINGPNLNLIGLRERQIYGDQPIEQYIFNLREKFPNVRIDHFQSNVEGELIDKIHEVGFEYNGIIINAGGYSHTSVALGDALAAVSCPCIEVHISNVYSREDYRHKSWLSKHCDGIISGFGLEGYTLALIHLISKYGNKR
jgi:3-dehydroquinate dehydratase II